MLPQSPHLLLQAQVATAGRNNGANNGSGTGLGRLAEGWPELVSHRAGEPHSSTGMVLASLRLPASGTIQACNLKGTRHEEPHVFGFNFTCVCCRPGSPNGAGAGVQLKMRARDVNALQPPHTQSGKAQGIKGDCSSSCTGGYTYLVVKPPSKSRLEQVPRAVPAHAHTNNRQRDTAPQCTWDRDKAAVSKRAQDLCVRASLIPILHAVVPATDRNN